VNNPALLAHPGGGFFLYFKSHESRMGVAVAERIDGPWVQLPFPVTDNERPVEDGYAFVLDDRICLLTTDNHGIIERGGGLLWRSDDGIKFDSEPEHGFHPLKVHLKGKIPPEARFHYGRETKFERPQILMRDGHPAYLYAPSGTALHGEDGTGVHLLRYQGK